ncbi:hypothetical protein ABH922_001588 [Rhodococcus sp. 27YEA15]
MAQNGDSVPRRTDPRQDLLTDVSEIHEADTAEMSAGARTSFGAKLVHPSNVAAEENRLLPARCVGSSRFCPLSGGALWSYRAAVVVIVVVVAAVVVGVASTLGAGDCVAVGVTSAAPVDGSGASSVAVSAPDSGT